MNDEPTTDTVLTGQDNPPSQQGPAAAIDSAPATVTASEPAFQRAAEAIDAATALVDRAQGGHFTVQDMRGGNNREDFQVRGYDAAGNLLLHTWHIGESSKQMECDAWRSRGSIERAV